MFDEIDTAVKGWIEDTIRSAGSVQRFNVETKAPTQAVELVTIFAFLSDVSRCRRSGAAETGAPSLELSYLLAVIGPDTTLMHQLLGTLLYGALQPGSARTADKPPHDGSGAQMGWQPIGYELDIAPIPVELWRALGVSPEPGVRLRVPVVARRSVPRAAVVREPLVLQSILKTAGQGTVP